MPSIGWQEVIILVVIVLLIFGTKRLPEVGRSMGGAIKEFKSGALGRNKEETATKSEARPEEDAHRAD